MKKGRSTERKQTKKRKEKEKKEKKKKRVSSGLACYPTEVKKKPEEKTTTTKNQLQNGQFPPIPPLHHPLNKSPVPSPAAMTHHLSSYGKMLRIQKNIQSF